MRDPINGCAGDVWPLVVCGDDWRMTRTVNNEMNFSATIAESNGKQISKTLRLCAIALNDHSVPFGSVRH